jgi:hypothetical protein
VSVACSSVNENVRGNAALNSDPFFFCFMFTVNMVKFNCLKRFPHWVLSRASRARLKAVATQKEDFENFLAFRLSTGDRLAY